jgi:hypothetical protein
MRKSLWRWLPVLSVVLVSGACADTSTEMESAEPRETSAATETTSKPKPTKPEADAQAQLACDHFRNVAGDIAAGVLTTEQVTTKFQEIYGTARRSEVPGVAEGAQELLSSWNTGDLDGVRSGVSIQVLADSRPVAGTVALR